MPTNNEIGDGFEFNGVACWVEYECFHVSVHLDEFLREHDNELVAQDVLNDEYDVKSCHVVTKIFSLGLSVKRRMIKVVITMIYTEEWLEMSVVMLKIR